MWFATCVASQRELTLGPRGGGSLGNVAECGSIHIRAVFDVDGRRAIDEIEGMLRGPPERSDLTARPAQLQLRIVKARHLVLAKTDDEPVSVVASLTPQMESFTTPFAPPAAGAPRWNETVMLSTTDVATQVVHLLVLNEDRKPLGTASIPVAAVLHAEKEAQGAPKRELRVEELATADGDDDDDDEPGTDDDDDVDDDVDDDIDDDIGDDIDADDGEEGGDQALPGDEDGGDADADASGDAGAGTGAGAGAAAAGEDGARTGAGAATGAGAKSDASVGTTVRAWVPLVYHKGKSVHEAGQLLVKLALATPDEQPAVPADAVCVLCVLCVTWVCDLGDGMHVVCWQHAGTGAVC